MVNPRKVISRKKQSKSNKLNEEYEFEHPLHSPEGACLQFVCQNIKSLPSMAKGHQIEILATFWIKG